MEKSLAGIRGTMKKGTKITFIILIVIILIPLGGLLFLTLAAYDPPPQEAAIAPGSSNSLEFTPETLRILTWNIGSAALNKNDGPPSDGETTGKSPNGETVKANLKDIGDFLSHQDGDVYFIQEVDRASSQTWKIDQARLLQTLFPDYSNWYSRNHKALFIPFPLLNPIAAVDSGILTLSRFTPRKQAVRHQLPGEYPWPIRTIHLKQCALIIRIPSPEAGRDWCLINIHLSAYKDGSLRAQQLSYLKKWMVELYEAKHFVVLGGAWNSFPTQKELPKWIRKVPQGWTPEGWQWGFDPKIPPHRFLGKPLPRGEENLETIIHGFLVSPNIEIKEIQGFDLAFKNSEHNPLAITLTRRQ